MFYVGDIKRRAKTTHRMFSMHFYSQLTDLYGRFGKILLCDIYNKHFNFVIQFSSEQNCEKLSFPPVGRTSKSRSVAILGQKIALISALALLGRSRCHVLPTPTLLSLGNLGGHLLQADEPVHPCLATQTLGWPPLRLSPPLAA